MKYPVIVHKDKGTGYGVTIPDIPGCFTGGETLESAIESIQEAVELYYDGEKTAAPPRASNIEDLANSDVYTDGGFWVLVDIDFSFLSAKTVRINISIPEYKLALIDKAARAKGVSRSAFLVQSAEQNAAVM